MTHTNDHRFVEPTPVFDLANQRRTPPEPEFWPDDEGYEAWLDEMEMQS